MEKKKEKKMEEPLQYVSIYLYYILVCQFHRYNPCNNQSLENMMAKVFKDKLPDLSDNHLVMKWFPFYNLKY